MLKKALTLIGLYFLLTFGIGAFFVFLDPNYFDYPIGRAEAGIPADKAPPAPFATQVTFAAGADFAVQLSMAAKDAPLRIRTELHLPDGSLDTGSIREFSLKNTASSASRVDWADLYCRATAPGTYSLNITQYSPGRITVYIFQGPFYHRLIGLPILAALFLFFIYRSFLLPYVWKKLEPNTLKPGSGFQVKEKETFFDNPGK